MYLNTRLEQKFNTEWARYYDSSVGRFLEEDPDQGKAKLPLTLTSKYIYSINSPINRIDPNGRISFKQVLGFAAIAINPVAVIGFLNTELGQETFDFSKRDVNRLNKFAITIAAVGLTVYSGGALGSVIGTVFGGGFLSAAVNPDGQFVDNFLSASSTLAGTGAVVQPIGVYSESIVPFESAETIVTILQVTQDPNVQYSLESLFGQNDGDIFPGIEF